MKLAANNYSYWMNSEDMNVEWPGSVVKNEVLFQGRTHIFKIHARSMSVERDIRFELLARLCPNSTGKMTQHRVVPVTRHKGAPLFLVTDMYKGCVGILYPALSTAAQ